MANEHLTQELKLQILADTEVAFKEVLGNVANFFIVKAEINEYRHDDEECHLQVEIINQPNEMEPNHLYFAALWTKGEPVKLMLGEDQDIDWELNAVNLWSLMYCWTFCKEE